jgi:hypothetical protein
LRVFRPQPYANGAGTPLSVLFRGTIAVLYWFIDILVQAALQGDILGEATILFRKMK